MFLTKLNQCLSDRGGNVGMIFAFAAVPVVAFIGSAVDYGLALRAKTELQSAVDIAAAAGARLPATSNQNRVQAVLASYEATTNYRHFATTTPQVSATNASVSVSAEATVQTAFMGLVGINSITVAARASARSQIENGGVACMIALSETSPDGLHLQGVNKVSSDNCWSWVNSTNSTAINATGASTGKAQGFCVAGGVDGAEHFSPVPYTGCSPMDDPFYDKFKNYVVPTICDHTDLNLNVGTHTLKPGVYCGKTDFRPQADVTLEPGLYVFKDGDLTVQAGSWLNGQGVTLFFYGQDTKMNIQGGADVTLKAPASGDLGGFVIVDRKLDWYDPSIRETNITGGGSIKIEGIVYTPQWKINVSGNGAMNQEAKFFTMVADSFYLEGSGKIYIQSDAEAAGLPDLMPKIKNGPVILE